MSLVDDDMFVVAPGRIMVEFFADCVCDVVPIEVFVFYLAKRKIFFVYVKNDSA